MHSASLKGCSTRRSLTPGPGEAEPPGELRSASSSGITQTLVAPPGDSTRPRRVGRGSQPAGRRTSRGRGSRAGTEPPCARTGRARLGGRISAGAFSPLLANVYLHHVLGLRADWRRRLFAHGEVIIVRLADGFIARSGHRQDAERSLPRPAYGSRRRLTAPLARRQRRAQHGGRPPRVGPYAARDTTKVGSHGRQTGSWLCHLL